MHPFQLMTDDELIAEIKRLVPDLSVLEKPDDELDYLLAVPLGTCPERDRIISDRWAALDPPRC